MARRWIDSVSDALRRVAVRHGTHTIRRPQLIAEELVSIVSETDSRGHTPEQTLNRTLQELRDRGVVRFGKRGVYGLMDVSSWEGESRVAADVEAASTSAGRGLVRGETYSWASLGDRFGFGADYLGAAGGMISRPKHNALLVMTHPGGAKSFDYGDYWDNRDLIYAGRGKLGDRKLEGQNRDFAESRRDSSVRTCWRPPTSISG